MSQTNIAMKHKKITTSKTSIKIINQHVNVANEYNNQACIQWYQELSMCNQDIGTHWSTNQTSHLLHLKFKLGPLVHGVSQAEPPFCGPRISLDAFPLNGETRFFIYLWKIIIFRKILGVTTYFCFIFLREKQNKKWKPLVWLPKEKKQVFKKPSLGPGIRLLIGKVR